MARFRNFGVTLSLAAVTVGTFVVGGCSTTQPRASRIRLINPPVDDFGRPMGPMPLAAGDGVGESVFMNRKALVARGLVSSDKAFADGSMAPVETGE